MSIAPGSSTLVLWRPPDSSITFFARAGVDAVRARLDGVDALTHATVHATCTEPPGFSLVPFRREPVALVMLRGSEVALEAACSALRSLPGRVERLDVETSRPLVRAASTPSRVCLLTLFRKAAHVDHETFLRRWFDEHTPMALEVHPLVGYLRHMVRDVTRDVTRESADAGAASWDGVVLEDFAVPEDLLTLRFFGRGPRALLNVIRVAWHVPTFLERSTLEAYLVEERVLIPR